MEEARTSSGNRAVISALRPLRWIDHPLLDLHTAVRVSYPPTGPDGMPDREALATLHTVEQDLDSVLGPRGRMVASETSNGLRILHYYSHSEDQNDVTASTAWPAPVAHSWDPRWALVRKFT